MPVEMLVGYYPKAGQRAALLALVQKHWPTLHALGLTTDTPARVWRAREKESNEEYFLEMYSWKTEESSDAAHRSPEVMAIWEAMEPVMEKLTLTQIEPLA